MKIEIKNERISTRDGISKSTGKPYSMRTQVAWLFNGEDYPVRLDLTLDNDQAPYPVGEYVFADECFQSDQYFRPVINRPKLVPLAAAAAKPSPARVA